ncbi:hypothetical protein V8G54_030530 [Vigna mungo]|uniref:Retrovirus-related Pol polyprotein from transposon TNT 1-94-like beta-barrel domain-containing protein n=1 Tax=Vigna mungo TaxID=3915 RepID=A0AAQ3MVB0_VIGMU
MLSIISQRKHEDRALQFLKGLNEQYGNIQSHVLLMDLIPLVSKIFSYVMQQERQSVNNNFLNHLESNNIIATISIVTYSFCGKTGHTDNVCFKNHGFPAKPSSNKKSCSHCGKTGHTVDVCYKKHGFPPGHKFYNEPVNDNQGETPDHEMCLTKQQYSALLALLNPNIDVATVSNPQIGSLISSSSGTGKTLLHFNITSDLGTTIWILDSSATDHVVSSLKHLHSYDQIKPVTTNLPNGITIQATRKGTIQLYDKICLKDVLYIPGFCYNLISISKLVLHNGVHVIFTNSTCFIQDSTTYHKIGSVDSHAGLYVFHGPNLTVVVSIHPTSAHNTHC